MLFVGFGFYSVFTNLFIVDWQINLVLFLVCSGGAIGYLGLTSLCWNLYPLGRNKQIVCLFIGLLTLIYVILAGIMSEQSLLMISNEWLDWYLFVAPIIMSAVQLSILLIDKYKAKEKS